jgi:hypothetical protein
MSRDHSISRLTGSILLCIAAPYTTIHPSTITRRPLADAASAPSY